jgi:4-alpha-glucanotransferase
MKKRASGILLHITSLPSAHGIGDIGQSALSFVTTLSDLDQRYWQILPLSPIDGASGNSPYNSASAYAGNELLISPEHLAREGLLRLDSSRTSTSAEAVDYSLARRIKGRMIIKAFDAFKKNRRLKADFDSFCDRNSQWLDDYAIFRALRAKTGVPWPLWPVELRTRQDTAPLRVAQKLKSVELIKFQQYIFFEQWGLLREHCREKGVRIIGDVPFYVNHDSADIWVHPELFKLDVKGRPRYVSGVPPDYFSLTGQKWNNPVYDWDEMRSNNFQWFTQRLQHYLKMFDLVRLDHFRGYLAYWEVHVSAKTAENGRWVKVPSNDLFNTVSKCSPGMPFVAEDLGVITPDVRRMMRRYNLPGMRVLLFAFSDAALKGESPRSYPENSVTYTGTHDTNTVRGWFKEEAGQDEKRNLNRYIDKNVSEQAVGRALIEVAMSSPSNLCVIPMQDILSLGSHARMNRPSKSRGNWVWRVTQKQLDSRKIEMMRDVTRTYDRC